MSSDPIRTTGAKRVALSKALIERDPMMAEIVVHAVAQLPNSVTVEFPSDLPQRSTLEVTARAYGIDDRVSFVREPGPPTAGDLFEDEATLAEVVHRLAVTRERPTSNRFDPAALRGQRAAIVTNVPTHYRVRLFSLLASRCVQLDAELCVFFLARHSTARPWMKTESMAFQHRYLSGIGIAGDRARRAIPVNLGAALRRYAPTILLCAGFSPAVSGRAARYASRRDIPFGVWSGEISSRRTARARLRSFQRRRLLRRADFAVAYGSEAARYLRGLRNDVPLVLGRNSTETPTPGSHRARPERVELLAVARAERDKALDVPIRAVRRNPELPCRLTIVGDGPELDALKREAAGDSRIRFLGAISSDEVQSLYQTSDAFLFPSHYDVFGLVVVEAMGAGIPPVLTTRPGVAADLCVGGHNCLLVESDDVDSWSSAIARIVTDHELRLALGAEAAETVEARWTVEHAADAMLAALRLGLMRGAAA